MPIKGNFAAGHINLTIVCPTAGEPTLPDGELVARAVAGDRDAFSAIYERYHAGVFRFARAMTASTVIAEDVTQEVFLAFMRALHRYDAERGSLSTYLYAIARNISRYRLRVERRFVGFDPDVNEPRSTDDAASQMSQTQTVARVRAMIRALPSRYREVLILCDLQGLTYEEAARAVDAPIGTVRSRLHRARQQLAQRVTQADAPAPYLGETVRRCLI